MFSSILGVLGGVLIGLLTGILTTYYSFGIFIGFIAAVVLFIFLNRRFTGMLQNIFFQANAELQKQRVDKAIEILKEGYKYNRWAFLVKAQIDSQIGIILYTQKKFGEAYKYLQNANARIHIAYAMLIIGHIKNGKKEKAIEAIPMLIKFNKKEAFVYSLMAYIYEEELNDREHAIEILQKGLKSLPNNQNLNDHLLAMQNNKKFKMEKYGEVWYQMMLEKKGISRLQQKYIRDQQKSMKTKSIVR